PNAAITAVDDISANFCIQGSMQFDSCYFGTVSEAFMVDIVDTVIIDAAEGTAHMPYDACLFTIVDDIVPYDVTADPVLMPSAGVQCAEDYFLFTLRAAFLVSAIHRVVART